MTAVTEHAPMRSEGGPAASERGLYQFLETMPVGVFIGLPGGQPYFANKEAERLLGRGVLPVATGDQLPELYQVYVAGTLDLYDADHMPLARALRGETPHADDLEVHWPDGTVLPLEVW